ncbi:DUF485 domain-containing protein [Rhizobium sp. BT-175]|uniref:DUF485 domain-containing protein n=1 Tax=Rhizobium sp. BT-175 TaxID=2986929 RepID=UPI00223587F9|nr:DUF485 domain-containing protein [Rhizobium sp. BT-175]MCV9947592.1 DUF485 domain-containing protein [Rhizobium sp. BT-175]
MLKSTHPAALAALVRKRWLIASTLSLAMIVIYFTFMGLLAFNKPILAAIVAPGISVALIVGPLIIVSSVALCALYVIWANKVYDPAIRALQD